MQYNKQKLEEVASDLLDAISDGLKDEKTKKDTRFLNFCWTVLRELEVIDNETFIASEEAQTVEIPVFDRLRAV